MLCDPNDELYSKMQWDVMWPNVVQQNVMWRKVAALFWKWFCILAPVPTIFEWKIDAQKNEKFSLCWKIVSISIRPSLLLLLSLSLSLAATLCQFLQWFDKSIQIFSQLIHPSTTTTTKEKTEKEEKDFKARREVRKGALFSSSSSIETFSIEEMLKLD